MLTGLDFLLAMAVSVLQTDPFHGYSAIFSPFSADKLAIVGGVNYGIAGQGGMLVYSTSTPPPTLAPPISCTEEYGLFKRYDWKDVLCDVTWSETHEPIIVGGAGDGSVIIFDQSKPEPVPVMELNGHSAEVSSVEWSVCRKEQLVLSGSWDTTIRMWDCIKGVCVSIWDGHHTDKIYRAQWSPRLSNIFSSVSGDGTLRIWDALSMQKVCGCVQVGGELLTCSWNKYDENIVATGGTDKLIRIWDLRQLTHPLAVFAGHTQSIKCVTFDPHTANILSSSGYDSSVRFWNTERIDQPHLQTINHHKEFTYHVEFSCHQKGLVVDCSWDKTVKVYTPSSLNPVTHLPS